MNEPVDHVSLPAPTFGDWATERLAKRWKSIVAVAFLGAVAACAYTAYRPAEYTGHLSIFFPSKNSVLGSTALVETTSPAAALTGSGPSPLRVYESFLLSETAVRSISSANNMRRELLMGKRSIDSDVRASVLAISYSDGDKERGLRVLRSHITELAKINRKVSFDTAADDAAVLRKRLRSAELQLKKSEDELIKFQDSLISAPSITSQQGGTITAVPESWAADLVKLRLEGAKVDAQLSSSKDRIRMLAKLPRDIPTELPPIKRLGPLLEESEYQLAVKKMTLGPQSPEIIKLEKSISAMKDQMETEIRAYLEGVDGGIIDPSVTQGSLPQLLVQKAAVDGQIAGLSRLANVAPEETVKLNRRFRQLALQAGVVQQLTTQVLTVSLQAQRDPNRWVVLDDPWMEEKPSNKSYLRMALSGALVGTILGGIFALLRRERRR